MITTMAKWVLIVSMHSMNQADDRGWNPLPTKYTTPQECEVMAQHWWQRYYDTYGNDMNAYLHQLGTTCEAETVKHKHYRWFITCDKLMNCHTRKYEGDY